MTLRDGYEDTLIIRWTVDSETGLKISQSIMMEDGTLNCDHMPAYSEFHHENGKVLLERWLCEGEGHRWAIDKPCEIRWRDDGEFIISEVYMRLGKVHRDHHRPAKIWYSEYNGNVIREEFWADNKLHRNNNLPAVVEYNDVYGEVTMQEYYVRGAKVDPHPPKHTL